MTRRRQSGPQPDDNAPTRAGVEVTFDGARSVCLLLVGCVLLEVAFVVLDYHVNYGGLTDIGALRRMTNIAREDGLASWFGTTQTLLAGLTAWAVLMVVRAQGALRWRRIGWTGTALLFSYMAVDDGAQLHERFGTVFRVLREDSAQTASTFFPSYSWQIVFGPIFGAFGLALAWFLWQELSDRVATAFVFVALSCFALAVGLDFIEGLNADHPWNLYTAVGTHSGVDAWTEDRFGRSGVETLDHFGRSLEEWLEMLGITLFWAAFLRHLTRIAPDLRLRWDREFVR